MMDSLNHYNWRHGDAGGRVAFCVKNDKLVLAQLSGQAPTPQVLGALFYGSQDLCDEASRLHKARENPWAVESRTGMSGCEDYLFRSLRDPELADAPIVARLHVSMQGKLNRGFTAWLGDVLPLLDAAGITPECVEEVALDIAPIFRPAGGWLYGGQRPGVDPPPPIVEIVKRNAVTITA